MAKSFIDASVSTEKDAMLKQDGSALALTGAARILYDDTLSKRQLSVLINRIADKLQETYTQSAGGGGELPVYLGQVGTRAILPRQRLGTSKQFNSKAFHRMAGAAPSPIFDFPGFMGANAVTTPTGTGDLAVGSTMALRASVEYPPGVFTRLRFGGSDTGTVPDRGILSADPAVGLNIAPGDSFYLWTNGVIAGSGLPVIYSTIPADNNYSLLGEAYEHAVSGLTDKSGGGSITTAGGSPGLVYRAVGIRAQTTKRSFCVIGNSRQAGFSGILHDANGQQGTIPRAVTDSGRGVTVCSIGGDLASVWSTPANVSARAALMDNVSDVVVCIGINDIAADDSAAVVQSRITTIVNAAVAKGKRVGRATINPRTTSTDSWATAANQTPVAQESVRVAVNDWLRNSANFPVDSYLIDIADMVEVNAAGVLTRNGGRWRTTGAFSTTVDGLHESLALNNELSAGIRAQIGI